MRRLPKGWVQVLTHVAALLPLALLLWDAWQGNLIIDPVKEITSRTGKTALILLLLTLACTPANTLFGFPPALRIRRPLALYAFMYAGLHVLTFVGLDYGFNLRWIGPALLDQQFTLPGLAAFFLLLLLAVTSTKGWQRRLGKNWVRLHRLVYLAGSLAVLHFIWLVKDVREPLRYAGVLAVLLLMRLP
ncbi:MAG: ferric reductase-like transmembrane domain-containing protein, partial [Anaerolineae bacterium]|nr:ferric reductase-like transmembrane domain-containing protein [Anaerolineae bacterium]